MDADKDGAVTLEEFLGRRTPGFAQFDKNNDGVVDAAEFDAAAKESSDYWIKRYIKRLDADKDGKISKDEFARRAQERFAMRDLNEEAAWTSRTCPRACASASAAGGRVAQPKARTARMERMANPEAPQGRTGPLPRWIACCDRTDGGSHASTER